MRTESRSRADDRPKIVRIGDAVKGDDQSLTFLIVDCVGEQIIRVRIFVGGQPQCDALVHGSARHTI